MMDDMQILIKVTACIVIKYDCIHTCFSAEVVPCLFYGYSMSWKLPEAWHVLGLLVASTTFLGSLSCNAMHETN